MFIWALSWVTHLPSTGKITLTKIYQVPTVFCMEDPVELEHKILNNFFYYFEHKHYQNTEKWLSMYSIKF